MKANNIINMIFSIIQNEGFTLTIPLFENIRTEGVTLAITYHMKYNRKPCVIILICGILLKWLFLHAYY